MIILSCDRTRGRTESKEYPCADVLVTHRALQRHVSFTTRTREMLQERHDCSNISSTEQCSTDTHTHTHISRLKIADLNST
jgi:hypothetical protein